MGLTEFKGLALAAFDVVIEKTDETDEYGTVQKATFVANPESTSTAKTSTAKTIFLRNFKEANRSGEFEAEVVEGKKLTDCLKSEKEKKKPLFCVHGWQGRPDYWLDECQKAQKDFDEKDAGYQLVPVLWPGNDNGEFLDFWYDRLNLFKDRLPQFGLNYPQSREDASQAAILLTSAFAEVDQEARRLANAEVDGSIRMDILGVSMGTYVIKELAKHRFNKNEKFSFDNIFLSAADIRGNIFTHPEGDCIVKMLRDGKVHAFYNRSDIILKGSTNVEPNKIDPEGSTNVERDGVGEVGNDGAEIGGFIWRSIVSAPRIFFPIDISNRKFVKRLGYGGAMKYGLGPSGELKDVQSGKLVDVPEGRVEDVLVNLNTGWRWFIRPGPIAQHGYLFDNDRIEYYKRTLQGEH